MTYVVYNTVTGKLASKRNGDVYFKSSGAATRVQNMQPANSYSVAHIEVYSKLKFAKVEVINIMTGQKVLEDINTPWHCSVASESYWCN